MGKKRTLSGSSPATVLASFDDADLLLEVRRRNLLPSSPVAQPTPATTAKQAYNNSGGGTPCWWTPDEDARLAEAVRLYGLARIKGVSAWPTIANAVATRTDIQCRRRWDYIRDKKVPGVTVASAPAPVAEVTKAIDVNAFFDHQLSEPQPPAEEEENPVLQHYGLLALETLDDDTDTQQVATTKHTEIIGGARRALSFAFDTHPLGETAKIFASEKQRYEAHVREEQAEVTRKELHRRLTLQRAETLEMIAFA